MKPHHVKTIIDQHNLNVTHQSRKKIEAGRVSLGVKLDLKRALINKRLELEYTLSKIKDINEREKIKSRILELNKAIDSVKY